MDAGADVNIRNANGAPALTFAVTFGQLQIAEWLLQKGALSDLPDAGGKTSLDHAITQRLLQSASSNGSPWRHASL